MIHANDASAIPAWHAFLLSCQRLIKGVAVMKLQNRPNTRELVDDLVQEVNLKLCGFAPASPAEFPSYGFVKVLTKNLVEDKLRRQYAGKRDDRVTGSIAEMQVTASNDADGSEERITDTILISEVDRALLNNGICRRDRTIFEMHFKLGMTTAEIAAVPNTDLSQKGVEAVIQRVRKIVRPIVRQRLKKLPAEDVAANREDFGD